MPSWDLLEPHARDAWRDRLLHDWISREVAPFTTLWGPRLREFPVRSAEDLRRLPIAEEHELSGAGGPGNPALLVLPTEEGFKRHAGRVELLRAARELRRRSGDPEADRRAVLFRRYKPVHVHEAGVARLIAIAYSRTDLDRLHLAGARLVEVLGLGAEDALVNAVPTGPSVRFWSLYHAALAARITALHPRSAGAEPVRAVARAFALLPATVLAVPVDEATALLDGLVGEGVRADGLRTLLAVGPPPSAEQRAALAEAAAQIAGRQVRVQAVWAPETARALWGECRPPSADPAEASFGLHTYPDLEILEICDRESGAALGEAEGGELVLTSLGWRGTALLRAATGAWSGGLVTTTPCPNCRRTVPRLAPEAAEGAWPAASGAQARAASPQQAVRG